MRWALLLVACSGCVGSAGAGSDQTSIGALACTTDDECLAGCEQIASDLRMPGADPPALTSSSCEAGGMGGTGSLPGMSGTGCVCGVAGGGEWIVGTWSSGCAVESRTRDCLYQASEFPGCTVGDATCGTVCNDVRRRLIADAAHVHDAGVHGAVCDGGVACRCVIALDGICRAWNPAGAPYDADCSLSAREILSEAGVLTRP